MTEQKTETAVLVRRDGSAMIITINREERRNAMNAQVLSAIEAGVRRAREDASIRAIVLTGAGRRAFCAGADLSGGTGVFSDGFDEPTTDFGRLARLVRDVGVPLIGRVNGDCVAGGMALMSLCDLVIAADHARFGLPEAKVGVFPMQVLVYLRKLIHPRHVNELCLTGTLIGAQRAEGIGLVNQVVHADELDSAVTSLIQRVCQMSPVALRRGKYAIHAMENMGWAEALPFAETQIAVASNTGDAREGLSAFNEKRNPRWTGA